MNKRLVKLEQPGCRPCGMVSQLLNSQGVNFESVDVTENTDMAEKYGVMSVPVTLLLDEEGNELQRSIGFNPGELEELISKL